MPSPHPLDDALRQSLLGLRRDFALTRGRVSRFLPDVGPFMYLPPDATAADWADASELCADNGAAVPGPLAVPADTWRTVMEIPVAQMIHPGGLGLEDPETVLLGPADVAEMTELVTLTAPGPIGPRTVELGGYRGLRRDGRLIGIAGERWRIPGWTEISMICTHPDHQGQGLAARLTRQVGAQIEARGEQAFLHVRPTNVGAVHLYEKLGFTVRTEFTITVIAPLGTVDPTVHER